jgi:uncharacterized protein (TIGR02246 family)
MKAISIFAFIVLLTTLGGAAQVPTSKTSTEEKDVHAAVEKMTSAWGNNDADSLEKLWSDDYTFGNPSGIFLTKAQRLSMLRSGRVKVENYSVDAEKVRIYGDTAIVTYRSTVKRQAEGREIESEQHQVLVVLVKIEGAWRAVAQQSTPVLVAPKRQPTNTTTDK